MEGDHNESLSMRFSGTENDLNHILSTFEDSEDEIKKTSLLPITLPWQIFSQFSKMDKVISWLLRLTYKASMQNLIIFMQLQIICLHLDDILVLFVFRKLGWHLTLTRLYLKYQVMNWYTKVQGVPDMGVWLYICMKDIVIKREIYIAALTFRKACSLMSPDIICGNG